MRVISIKNIDTVSNIWGGKLYTADESYNVPQSDWALLQSDEQLYEDIVTKAQVSDGSTIFSSSIDAWNWILGNVVQTVTISNENIEVVPTAPKNEHNLRPYGLGHGHIDASDQIYDITLSNKVGQDIDYSNCTTTPAFYDCIFQDHSVVRDGIASVSGSTITTFLGRLEAGSAKLTRGFDIDYKVQIEEADQLVYLWGVFIEAEGYGEDDILRLQVVDTDGVGVALGYYTQQEFDYLCSIYGGAVILKEYDECWVRHVSKIIEVDAPDGSPGRIPVGAVLRIKYYAKDATKTDIRVWSDYKVTLKD